MLSSFPFLVELVRYQVSSVVTSKIALFLV